MSQRSLRGSPPSAAPAAAASAAAAATTANSQNTTRGIRRVNLLVQHDDSSDSNETVDEEIVQPAIGDAVSLFQQQQRRAQSLQPVEALLDAHGIDVPVDQEDEELPGLWDRYTRAEKVVLTGFEEDELEILWGDIEIYFIEAAHVRGRRAIISPRDSLFALLTWLHGYPRMEMLCVLFRLKFATLNDAIMRTLDMLHAPLVNEFIVRKRDAMMAFPVASNPGFPNYDDVILVVDSTFQPMSRPGALGFDGAKVFFSGKHKQYGLKKESAHNKRGEIIFNWEYDRGSSNDLTIFRKHGASPAVTCVIFVLQLIFAYIAASAYRNFLSKRSDGVVVPEGVSRSIMMDKGYLGAGAIIKAIIPHRKPRGADLTRLQVAQNERIAADRILVENFYGRLKKKFSITREKFRNDLRIYNQAWDVCAALTNFHIALHPLRQDDGAYNREVERMLEEEARHIGNIAVERRERVRRARARRFERLRNLTPY